MAMVKTVEELWTDDVAGNLGKEALKWLRLFSPQRHVQGVESS
jgi:hypothetical protein